MITPADIRFNHLKYNMDRDILDICEGGRPVVSWAVLADYPAARQTAYRLSVSGCDGEIWNSGWVETDRQECLYGGEELRDAAEYNFAVTLRDGLGEEGEAEEAVIAVTEAPKGAWIGADADEEGGVVRFRKRFRLNKPVRSAVIYYSGIGISEMFVNDETPHDYTALDPAFTDYSKRCDFVVEHDFTAFLHDGDNCVDVLVGDGWRRNHGAYLHGMEPRFFGKPMLIFHMRVTYEDGSVKTIRSGADWHWTKTPITANLFDGETYDASVGEVWRNVTLESAPCEVMTPMTLPPVCEDGVFEPVSVRPSRKGAWIVDFGQNMAGVAEIELPNNMPKGHKIVVRYAELLDEDGSLYTAPLRGAKVTDTYIASGDDNDLGIWKPRFTYHGFRYAEVEGMRPARPYGMRAVRLRTHMEERGLFTCGSALVNRIHQNCVATEKSNQHGILTDCPQRDERMGWMNDATVRFEMTPYNFETAAIYRKLVRDILDDQREGGAMGCTAPFVYGSHPADPVCSSFLVAAWENYLHDGDLAAVREGFDGFKAWENCLLEHSDDYIVNYSCYGDWAGPAYACEGDDGARSIITPGEFMSTGYSYFNCTLLARFAALMGDEVNQKRYEELALAIRGAMLKKWYDPLRHVMATGSEACQAFSLWLSVIPEADRQDAARIMRDDLVKRDYAFTTGNLCTRYLFDMLAQYGYIEDAWKLLTKETYPSYGFMIQNEATTVWERFEMKKNPGMNSHNHPMYAAVDYFFYAYLAGIRPVAGGYREAEIAPFMPEGLLSAEGRVDTPLGELSARWIKRYGKAHLYVNIPVGCRAKVSFMGSEHVCENGFHHFEETL